MRLNFWKIERAFNIIDGFLWVASLSHVSSALCLLEGSIISLRPAVIASPKAVTCG